MERQTMTRRTIWERALGGGLGACLDWLALSAVGAGDDGLFRSTQATVDAERPPHRDRAVADGRDRPRGQGAAGNTRL